MKIRKFCLIIALLLLPSLTAKTQEIGFREHLKTYFEAYQNRNYRIIFASLGHISLDLFDKRIPQHEYLEHFKTIDQNAQEFPGATADLARYLQGQWEKRYLLAYEVQQLQGLQKENVLSWIGFLVGTGALFKNPTKVISDPAKISQYLLAFKNLFVPASLCAGGGIVAGKALRSLTGDELPPPPAILLKMGTWINGCEITELEKDESIRNLTCEAVGVAAGWAAYTACTLVWTGRTLQTVNVACTPVKVHPGVLIGSVAVGFIVDRVVFSAAEGLMKYGDERSLQNTLIDALSQWEEAIHKTDDFEGILGKTTAVVDATIRLETFYRLSIFKIMRDYQVAYEIIQRDEKKSPQEKWTEEVKLKGETVEKVIPLLREEALKESPLFEKMTRNEWDESVCVRDLSEGKVYDDAGSLLIQVASFLNAKGKSHLGESYMNMFADDLLNRAIRVRIFLKSIL